MSLFILEGGESMVWRFRLGRMGVLRASVDASDAVSVYLVEAADFDDEAEPDELPAIASSRRRLSHRHDFNLAPGSPVVVIAINPGDQRVAVEARVGTK